MTAITEYLKISASPYVNALLSLLVFAAVAKIADVLLNRVFRKFARFTKSDVDDRIIDVIHRPIYFTIILIGCTFAVAYLKGSPGIVFYADSTAYSVISVVWAITAIKIINILIEYFVYGASDETGLRKDIVPLTENIFKVIIIAGRSYDYIVHMEDQYYTSFGIRRDYGCCRRDSCKRYVIQFLWRDKYFCGQTL